MKTKKNGSSIIDLRSVAKEARVEVDQALKKMDMFIDDLDDAVTIEIVDAIKAMRTIANAPDHASVDYLRSYARSWLRRHNIIQQPSVLKKAKAVKRS